MRTVIVGPVRESRLSIANSRSEGIYLLSRLQVGPQDTSSVIAADCVSP